MNVKGFSITGIFARSSFDQKLMELEEKRKEYAKKLSQEYKRPDNPLIPMKNFRGLEKGAWIELADGVRSHLVELTTEGMTWVVISKKGGTIGKHRHDSEEDIKVLEGKIVEKINEITLTPEDEPLTISAFEPHHIYAEKFSIYSVFMKFK